MPKAGEIDFVVNQLQMSVDALRQAEEGYQALELACHDQAERARIRERWNELEEMQDELRRYQRARLQEYRRLLDGWALQTLKQEPSYAVLAAGVNGRSNGNGRGGRQPAAVRA